MAWFVCLVFTKDGYREEVECLMARYDLFRHALFIPAPEPTGLLRSRYERRPKRRISFEDFVQRNYGYEYDEKAGQWGKWVNPEAKFELFDIDERPFPLRRLPPLCRRARALDLGPESESYAFVTPEGEWHETEQFFRVGDGDAPPVDHDSPYECAWRAMLRRALDENLFVTRVEYYI